MKIYTDKQFWRIFFMCLVFSLFPSNIAHVEASTVQQEVETEPPQSAEAQHPDVEYTKNTNIFQTTMHGVYSDSAVYFEVPTYWDVKYVYVKLQYKASELIKDTESSLTFYLNDTLVSSYRIGYADGNTQECYVELPVEQLKEGYNSFSFSAYAMLEDEEGCKDEFPNINWLSISDQSFISCGYNVVNDQIHLSDYPYPFLSTMDSTGSEVAFVVSDGMNDSELGAAMTLMAGMGDKTEEKNQIQLCTFSDLAVLQPRKKIIISLLENLPDAYKTGLDTTLSLKDQAYVGYSEDGEGNPALLITSEDGECLMEAVNLLLDDERIAQESGNATTVSRGSAELKTAKETADSEDANTFTLGDISNDGLNYVGPFRQEKMITLPYQDNYALAAAGKVSLKFRYSSNLNFTRSLVTVYWGDTPVASKKLEKDKTEGDELVFTMPEDVVGTSADSIKITFDLEIEDMICTPRSIDMPWAYVSPESEFTLPIAENDILSFDNKPAPFQWDRKYQDVMLVLPEQPTTAELNLGAQLLAAYSGGIQPYGTIKLIKANEFDQSDSDYQIITVGTYEDNALIQKVNDDLSISYLQDGSQFDSNEQVIFSNSYDQKTSVLQLIQSPFTTGRGLLAASATSSEGIDLMVNFLRDKSNYEQMTKDAVVLKTENVSAYQFLTEQTEGDKPDLVGSIVKNKQSLIFTIVSTSAMLLLFLAVLLVLIRIKMHNQKSEHGESDDQEE